MNTLLGFLIGFVISEIVAGRKSGQDGLIKSIKFKYKSYTIHVHHWIWSLVLLLVLVMLQYSNNFIYSLLLGICIQGLTYKDFYKTIYKHA